VSAFALTAHFPTPATSRVGSQICLDSTLPSSFLPFGGLLGVLVCEVRLWRLALHPWASLAVA